MSLTGIKNYRALGAGALFACALIIGGCQHQTAQNTASNNSDNTVAMAPTEAPANSTAKIDAGAQQLMAQMVSTYQKMNSYSSTTEFKNASGSQHGRIAWAKPNKLLVLIGDPQIHILAVSNGKMLYGRLDAAPSAYMKFTAPPNIPAVTDTFEQSGLKLGLTADPTIFGDDPVHIIGSRLKSLSSGPTDTVDGFPVNTVVLKMGDEEEMSMTYSIGQQDHLLHGVRADWTAEGKPNQWEVIHKDIKVNPTLSDAAFHFTPPTGAQPVDSFVQQSYDHHLAVGTRPFPFTAKDLAGQSVSLEQYKGKVVLLDFWATWCGPCVASMPDVIKAYNKYNSQGFEVVGISLDQSRDDLNQFLKDQSVPWRQICSGEGWAGPIPRRYGVTAIPFTLLIGRDGRIAAVNLFGDDLAPTIEKELAKTASS
ncbi:MAG: redoxin domain-containing protein [Abitibacteriaceae bacterium]|nr:redoxin domain-containing protein [Abditibacteriaceae bacterium]